MACLGDSVAEPQLKSTMLRGVEWFNNGSLEAYSYNLALFFRLITWAYPILRFSSNCRWSQLTNIQKSVGLDDKTNCHVHAEHRFDYQLRVTGTNAVTFLEHYSNHHDHMTIPYHCAHLLFLLLCTDPLGMLEFHPLLDLLPPNELAMMEATPGWTPAAWNIRSQKPLFQVTEQ